MLLNQLFPSTFALSDVLSLSLVSIIIIIILRQYLKCVNMNNVKDKGTIIQKNSHWLYDCLNRYVFSLDLNCSTDVDVLIKFGGFVQNDGPATENDRSPSLVFDLEMTSWL